MNNRTILNNRIRRLRKFLDMTQSEFGEKLGVSRDVIGNIEGNRVGIKDLLINHICEVYNVNINWLKTGEGDMFIDKHEVNKKLDEAIEVFKSLQPKFQDYALELIKNLADLQKE